MILKFLYRALREEEIKAGNILIPKGHGPFKADPRLGVDTILPFVLGPTAENAVRHHQLDEGFITSGVSTTPHLIRAKYYAQRRKVIAKIDRAALNGFAVTEFNVKEYLSERGGVKVPEDEEIILVREVEGKWPKKIIAEIISVSDWL